MQAVHTKTRVEYDELMDILEKKWGSWSGHAGTKAFDAWKEYEHNTCIDIEEIDLLSVADIEYFTNYSYTILSINQYKAMNDIKECEFKRGEVILVRNHELQENEEAIFIAHIEWGKYPYICVINIHEEDFTQWNTFCFLTWKYAQKKPTPSPEDIQKAKKLLIETWEKWSTY